MEGQVKAILTQINSNFRILDLFNLIVLIAQREVEHIYNAHVALFREKLQKSVPLTILYDDFDQHEKFKALLPDERTIIIKNSATLLIEKVFLGDYGFTGPLGLTEFEESRETLRAINEVKVRLFECFIVHESNFGVFVP